MRHSVSLLATLAATILGCAPAPPPPADEKPANPIKAAQAAGSMLGVGKPAPDIEGSDIDGKLFKLSDYRGKVVMLDFWGHWCGPCRGMYPHNRELVKDKDKSFALIGINVGDSEVLLRHLRDDGEITWRFWLDRDRDVTRKWHITAFPTIFLLDRGGVVRFEFLGPQPGIDKALQQLLRGAGAS